jgi:hypothetical protein
LPASVNVELLVISLFFSKKGLPRLRLAAGRVSSLSLVPIEIASAILGKATQTESIQRTLTEREGPVRLTSSLRYLVWQKNK